MIVDPTLTLAELEKKLGADAVEVRAFALWLSRNPSPDEGPRQCQQPDYDYAMGKIGGLDYLRAVAPDELAATDRR